MFKKPKIFVFAHESEMNGASHSLLTILTGLKDQYEFLVIVPAEGLMANALRKNNINYKLLNLPRCGYFNYISFIYHLKITTKYYKNKRYFNKKLISVVNEFQPDIIYTNTSVLSWGFDIAKKIKKPHVWHIREYGYKDFKIVYIPFRANIILKMKQSAVSIFTTNLLKKHWVGINQKNAEVVFNGVFEEINPGKNKFIFADKDEVVLGIVGIVIETKGYQEAIEILKTLLESKSKVKLFIFGSTNNVQFKLQLEKKIEEFGLIDKVIFKGYVSDDLIYNSIDILLSCAKDEAFGRTIIEAMSHGVPVVVKNSGGPTEIIQDGHDGFLYDTILDASEKLNILINDSFLYEKISKSGLNSAQNKFSKECYIAKMNTIFKNNLEPDTKTVKNI